MRKEINQILQKWWEKRDKNKDMRNDDGKRDNNV